MEPINYREAIVRRWPVLVVAAVVGAIVAVLIPVHAKAPKSAVGGPLGPGVHYQACTLIGVPPQGSGNAGTGSLKLLEFYSANEQLITAAAQSAGITSTKDLSSDVFVGNLSAKKAKKKKGAGSDTIDVCGTQHDAKDAAALSTAYLDELRNYINEQYAVQHQADIASAAKHQQVLQAQLNALLAQEAASTTAFVTPAARAGDIVIAQRLTPRETPASSPVILVSSDTGSSTSTSLPSTTTSTSTTTTATSTTTTSTTTTTDPAPTTTVAPKPKKLTPQQQALQSEISSTQSQLNSAIQKVAALEASSAQTVSFVVLQPASPKSAKRLTSKTSLFEHRSVRGLIGLVGGALVGVAIAFLLDGLDKRLRTAARAREAFGFPVVAEIPARGPVKRSPRSQGTIPRTIVVASAPTSASAESYRMLRMALLLEPLASLVPETERSSMDPVAFGTMGAMPSAAVPSAAPGGLTVVTEPPPRVEPGGRRVVLVLSPGNEPTRPIVVANLAAAYAEAGERVIVVTTGDLRRGADSVMSPSLNGSVDPADIEAVAQPSDVPGVSTVSAGRLLAGPGQLSTHGAALLRSASKVADVVLAEAPVLMTADADALVPAADAVVVVAQSWHTRVDQAVQTGERLRRVAAPVLGVALTEVQLSKRDLRRGQATRTSRRTGSRRTPSGVAAG